MWKGRSIWLSMIDRIMILLLLLLFTNCYMCNKLKPISSNCYDRSTLLYLLVVYLMLCVSYVFGVLCVWSMCVCVCVMCAWYISFIWAFHSYAYLTHLRISFICIMCFQSWHQVYASSFIKFIKILFGIKIIIH